MYIYLYIYIFTFETSMFDVFNMFKHIYEYVVGNKKMCLQEVFHSMNVVACVSVLQLFSFSLELGCNTNNYDYTRTTTHIPHSTGRGTSR